MKDNEIISYGKMLIKNTHYWFRDKIDLKNKKYEKNSIFKSIEEEKKWDFDRREEYWKKTKKNMKKIEKAIEEKNTSSDIGYLIEKLENKNILNY